MNHIRRFLATILRASLDTFRAVDIIPTTRSGPATLLALIFLSQVALAGEVVNISAFGIRPDASGDATPAVHDALARCRAIRAGKLVFPPGRYDFWPGPAVEKYCFVSNKDEGFKNKHSLCGAGPR